MMAIQRCFCLTGDTDADPAFSMRTSVEGVVRPIWRVESQSGDSGMLQIDTNHLSK